jgi:O-antigen/teichoic acid export membrane protein
MATLRRNVIANLAGGVCIAALTLLITPVQISLLGIEAYGVIGFIATLQVVATVLDFGLSSTITREIAGDSSAGKVASQGLLRTALTLYWTLAAVVGILIVAIAGLLARRWFNPDTIDQVTLTRALQVAALYLALRWPVSLYTGVLSGMQRMDALNGIRTASTALRLAGGIGVLLIWPNLSAFLLWTGLSSVAEVAVYAVTVRRVLPRIDWRPGFSAEALRSVWGFTSQMAALAILSVALTQLDRLMISRMLPLEQLGYYALAYTAATGVSLVISSLSTALMPSFAAAHGAGEQEVLLARYHGANQAMLYASGLVLFALVFFGRPLMELWVAPAAAAGAWVPLALLACGFWFSAAISNAYTVSIASRRARGPLVITVVTGILYGPLMFLMISRWGIAGAALAWLLLNLSYVAAYIPFVHRRILKIPVLPWFTRLLLPFVILGCITFGLARTVLLVAAPAASIPTEIAMLAIAAAAYVGLGFLLLDPRLKNSLTHGLCAMAARLR